MTISSPPIFLSIRLMNNRSRTRVFTDFTTSIHHFVCGNDFFYYERQDFECLFSCNQPVASLFLSPFLFIIIFNFISTWTLLATLTLLHFSDTGCVFRYRKFRLIPKKNPNLIEPQCIFNLLDFSSERKKISWNIRYYVAMELAIWGSVGNTKYLISLYSRRVVILVVIRNSGVDTFGKLKISRSFPCTCTEWAAQVYGYWSQKICKCTFNNCGNFPWNFQKVAVCNLVHNSE